MGCLSSANTLSLMKKETKQGVLMVTLTFRAKKKFILAPYLQSSHWVLLLISPSTYTVYQFDSCRVQPPRDLMIMTWLNHVMKKIRLSMITPNLISVKCAQQQNGVDCGYYVMRYIYDIISSCTNSDDVETVLSTSVREGSFTAEEIGEVRDKLAKFLYTHGLC